MLDPPLPYSLNLVKGADDSVPPARIRAAAHPAPPRVRYDLSMEDEPVRKVPLVSTTTDTPVTAAQRTPRSSALRQHLRQVLRPAVSAPLRDRLPVAPPPPDTIHARRGPAADDALQSGDPVSPIVWIAATSLLCAVVAAIVAGTLLLRCRCCTPLHEDKAQESRPLMAEPALTISYGSA
ncbi:hypothetical protein RI367_001832 [Sorochytrium milnesiophthora]